MVRTPQDAAPSGGKSVSAGADGVTFPFVIITKSMTSRIAPANAPPMQNPQSDQSDIKLKDKAR